jgi:AraC family transcriptional regulator
MFQDAIAPVPACDPIKAVRRVGELTLREFRYDAGDVIPRHAHAAAYFTVVLSGSYEERGVTRERLCSGDRLAFYPEGEVHVNRFLGRGGHVLRVDAHDAFLQRLRTHAPILKRPVDVADADARVLGRRLWQEFQSHDRGAPLAIEGLTLELLSIADRAAFRPERRRVTWLSRAEEILRAHVTEPIGLEALAAEVGVHPCHLARAFRAHHRCTVGEFVRRLRVEQACARLADPDVELAALATELGFVDQSHFSRVFKRHVGRTPSEYRRSA